MLVHPQWDPIALSLGPLAIRWYGLSYVVAFVLFIMLGRRLAARPLWAQRGWTARDVDDLIIVGMLGVIIGGRLGYIFFYKPGHYLANPLDMLKVWEGGLSFHGGLIGILLGLAAFAWHRGRSFLEVGDFVAPCVPTGIASVRWFGNFVNGELWGRAADPSVPWAMVFPQSGTTFPRHPSQLYQGALEGLLLFVILWIVAKRNQPLGRISGVFLMGYGVLRFFAEFFRQPDSFLGFLALGMTMGQWLCVPMIIVGAWLIVGAPGREASRKTAL